MKRRRFLGNVTLGTVGIFIGDWFVCRDKNLQNSKLQIHSLKTDFLNPPEWAKPQTWWHWREGRISEEVITAELEALKEIGIGGVTLFHTARYGEIGEKVPCLSPQWHEKVKHTIRECNRLGIKLIIHNCA